MRILEYIHDRLSYGRLHMTLLDPEKQTPEVAGEWAFESFMAGTDAVMVGGSTGVTQEKVDGTVLAIKSRVRVPVILFPGGVSSLSRYADALYFMSLLNSRDVRHVVREQKKAALVVREMGLEPIPMGYLVVEPGMKVGEVGKADLIPRDKPQEAVEYALAAQHLGMKLVYLEAGSGSPLPVPAKMVSMVKRGLSIPLVVGGGIRTPETAREIALAGADIVVTGTIMEEAGRADVLRDIVDAVKGR